MKNIIESALASLLQERIPNDVVCRPMFRMEELPDSGTTIIVDASIESRAGTIFVVEVSFEIQTVVGDTEATDKDRGPIDHMEIAMTLRDVVSGIESLSCGSGITLHGKAYLLGDEGRIDGNTWVSSMRYRLGVQTP